MVIAFLATRMSAKPADEEHSFSHGKIESISAVAKATLIFTAAGLLVELVVIRITSLSILDPVITLVVSMVIIKSAYKVIRKSFAGLMDARLPGAEESEITVCLQEPARW